MNDPVMTPSVSGDLSPAATPITIPRLLFDSAQRFAGRTAIEDQGVGIDYAQLPGLALEVTRGLMALGIQPGERVGVWAPNGRD